MPIYKHQMMAKTKKTMVNFQGESLEVTYRQNVITAELIAEVDAMADKPDESIALQVKRAIVEWDLLDENGQALPVTDEVVRSLPREFLLAVINGAVADMNAPGADEKKG